MAEPLVTRVMGIGGFDSFEILESHPGSFFENMLASHPFLPKTSRLLLADYVTMDSGTGCVHTAPGFGADDYQTCTRYGIEMVVPVDDQGRHTEYAVRRDHPQLPALLALQEPDYLPRHTAVVLLRGFLQGGSHCGL